MCGKSGCWTVTECGVGCPHGGEATCIHGLHTRMRATLPRVPMLGSARDWERNQTGACRGLPSVSRLLGGGAGAAGLLRRREDLARVSGLREVCLGRTRSMAGWRNCTHEAHVPGICEIPCTCATFLL